MLAVGPDQQPVCSAAEPPPGLVRHPRALSASDQHHAHKDLVGHGARASAVCLCSIKLGCFHHLVTGLSSRYCVILKHLFRCDHIVLGIHTNVSTVHVSTVTTLKGTLVMLHISHTSVFIHNSASPPRLPAPPVFAAWPQCARPVPAAHGAAAASGRILC